MRVRNFASRTDSYKHSHWKLLPDQTEELEIYLESRGGEFEYNHFIGLQYYMMEYLTGSVISVADVERMRRRAALHFGSDDVFNYDGWMDIAIRHNGKLPIEIFAVPEGTILKNRNCLFKIRSIDPKTAWIVESLETLLQKIWSPVTIASNSIAIKKVIIDYLKISGADISAYPFSLVDFGYRGVSSEETAEILGAAFLSTGFMASDNWGGIELCDAIYDCEMAAYSVPATEHLIHTIYGKGNEDKVVRKMIGNFKSAIRSLVIDSFNAFFFIEMIGTGEIRKLIDELPEETKIVCRPDSGDAIKIIFGDDNPNYPDEKTNEFARKGIMNMLWEYFGGYENEKGLRVLNRCKVLQGDGISLQSIPTLFQACIDNGYSTENLVLGSGGKLLQAFDRDTNKFAVKCNRAIVMGEEVSVIKDPITDQGKRSKGGDLKVVFRADTYEYETIESSKMSKEEFDSYTCIMVKVYSYGEVLIKYTLDEIRERSHEHFNMIGDKLYTYETGNIAA